MTVAPPISERPARPLWQAALLLFAISVLVYVPTFSAGFIWDDPDYIINNANLRDLPGLARTWLQPRSLPQWYPLVHTTFWLEYQVWGLWAPGYHIVNAVLHAVGAVALWWLLLRLELSPKVALFGALLWSVHPVQVESVAWVTERKNTLSALLYFLSLAALVRWEGHRTEKWRSGWGIYLIALLLFAAALASKTVTASLPAAWLLIVYWRRGRITLRGDVLPMLPFFAIGFAAGQVTAWLERHHVGAVGAEWAFSPLDRCLIAGRAIAFYLYKLALPLKLAFIYERWEIDGRQLWQYLFPVAALGLLAALFLLRKQLGRAPFVAYAFFVGTLFPALGFFNVYPFRYSFVADHFQHLASVGPLVLLGAAAARWPKALSAALVGALCVLTLAQTRVYKDALALWADTTEKTPSSWMAQVNLGQAYWEQSDRDASFRSKALQSMIRARDLAPNHPEPNLTLGEAYARLERYAEARQSFEASIALDPSFARPEQALGKLYLTLGDLDRAKQHLLRALHLQPAFHLAHATLAEVYEKQGLYDEALVEYARAITSDPTKAAFHISMGNLLLSRGTGTAQRPAIVDAAGAFAAALRLEPGNPAALLGLGKARLVLGNRPEAEPLLRRAAAADPQLFDEVARLLAQ